MKHIFRTALAGPFFVLISVGVNTQALAGGGPMLSASLPEATVTIALPGDKIDVGSNATFKISVEPRNGIPAPERVRARLGMPIMGHWVTDEESQAYGPELAFDFQDHRHMDSTIPMYGIYRLRVWLGYAGGHDATTAIDFKVMTDEPLNPEIVQ